MSRNGVAESDEIATAIEQVAEHKATEQEQTAAQQRAQRKAHEKAVFERDYLALCIQHGWHVSARIVNLGGRAPTYQLTVLPEAQEADDDVLTEYGRQLDVLRQATES